MNRDILWRQRQQRGRTRLLLWLMVLIVLAGVALWFWQRRLQDRPHQQDVVVGVASVIDGDTLEIRGTKIRLYGVDAPESTQTCQRGRQTYPCGRDAAHALSQLLGQKTVSCQRQDTDRYGRTVALCRVGNVDVNGWLVASGHALAYREYSTRYVPQENAARQSKKGIHAGTYVNPSDYRRGETLPPSAPGSPRRPYASCAQARAAGKTPVLKSEPGYNPKLDGDRDGRMCE